MSCEGQESPNNEHMFEESHIFAAALQPTGVNQSPQWVCHAASGSQLHQGTSATICAGEHAQKADTAITGELKPTYDRAQSSQGLNLILPFLKTTPHKFKST